jgi:hypothetical protein
METYKLTLAFEDLNQVIDFYKIGMKKPLNNTLAMIASMGSKGQVVSNPDGLLSLTWYFRNQSKYDKVIDAYLKCRIAPSYYIPGTQRHNYQI